MRVSAVSAALILTVAGAAFAQEYVEFTSLQDRFGVTFPVLDKIDVGTVASQGYSFQVELAWRAYRHRFRVAEVPITFTERERGASKMSGNIFKEQLLRVTGWGLRARRDALMAKLSGKQRTGSTWP